MIRIGLIGYGYWGPNLARNFSDIDGATVVAIADTRPERLAAAARRFSSARVTWNVSDVMTAADVDAIAIATPVSTHFALASAALNAGKHVLVEKPLASTSDESQRLIELADRHRLVLMVDHTFIYSGAVQAIQKAVSGGEIGDLYYYDSVRVNLGLFQHDVNVLWDLAVHDLSIMDFVLPMRPREVSATGLSHVPGRSEDVAYLTLFFDAPAIAHIHVNWMSPVKVRRTLIGASRRMIVYDDLDPGEQMKVYDKGIQLNESPDTIYQMLIAYRIGDMWAPKVDRTEPLRHEVAHFLACVRDGTAPITGGDAGLRVVRILEAATTSMARKGTPVVIAGATP